MTSTPCAPKRGSESGIEVWVSGGFSPDLGGWFSPAERVSAETSAFFGGDAWSEDVSSATFVAPADPSG